MQPLVARQPAMQHMVHAYRQEGATIARSQGIIFRRLHSRCLLTSSPACRAWVELLLDAARGGRAMQAHADHLRRTQSWADDYAAPSSAAGLALAECCRAHAGARMLPALTPAVLRLVDVYQHPQDSDQQILVTRLHSPFYVERP